MCIFYETSLTAGQKYLICFCVCVCVRVCAVFVYSVVLYNRENTLFIKYVIRPIKYYIIAYILYMLHI